MLIAMILFSVLSTYARFVPARDTIVTSTRQQAIEFLNQVKELAPSAAWPNIEPGLFLQNLRASIEHPVTIYPGNGTNFCGYGALTYLFLLDDPLGFAKLLLQLYREGAAFFGETHFTPSDAIKKAAGLLRFKGVLDIRPAEQLWFLCLADHYKGYLNFFNRRYKPDDEDKFWASVNYSKFNRMLRKLLRYKVKAKGADLIRPRVGDRFAYISEKMKTGTVVLYINNRIVHKKNHVTIKLGFPTHFIVAEKISLENNLITLVYWDYGSRTQLQLSPAFFKRVLYGITYCSKKGTDE
ncbi:MAG: hypothetical protein ABIN52_15950 [Chitinophagaceae bacterium]